MFRRMLLSSLAARRARLALGLVAVSLGVGVATALGTLALQVGDDLARTLRAAGPNFVVLPPGSRPSFARLSRTSAIARALRASALTRSMASRGAPAGAARPNHDAS